MCNEGELLECRDPGNTGPSSVTKNPFQAPGPIGRDQTLASPCTDYSLNAVAVYYCATVAL